MKNINLFSLTNSIFRVQVYYINELYITHHSTRKNVLMLPF